MPHKSQNQYTVFSEHSIIVNILITAGILVVTTATSFLFFFFVPDNYAIIYLLYILALIFIARYTTGYAYGIVSSLIAVVCVNYIFTYPFFKINFTLSGYPLTFAVMLTITLITSTMTSNLCRQAKIIKEREQLLREAELEKMRANLLRAVSHDLRTPLTGILGNSSGYLENTDKLTDAEKKLLVSSIHIDAEWLLNMVENLLTVTRIQGDNLQINTSLESVEEVVSEALLRLKKRFPDSVVNAVVPDEMLFIPMDAVLIEQVIINLIENAIVHSDTIDPIELIVSADASFVSFTIKDYGKGLSPNRLEHLFDGTSGDFEKSSDTHKGMGIGLSICKTIITAHRGEIYGENHDTGAQFCFCLPVTKK
ncbi:MAG: DUF4118 domain-containing protein [Lachnospiraceae bacterium]|nr:DUF4118 domain-containing protein [Lachnospiraceae bacterium]